MSSELHIAHYDDEPTMTIEAHDAEATTILKELGATHIRDHLYRLPVNQVVTFLARRFKLVATSKRHRLITDEQRKARSENMRKARAQRWMPTAH
jgi:hypothetical protein